jgi:uncharacterized YigZ family protein
MPDEAPVIILSEHAQAETNVKNSRFLCEAHPVQSPEEVREIIHRQKNKYPDIRHVVHAFSLGPKGAILGCSDDGEPAGTAGRPTLEVLKGSGITNILLTTTRWFGGIKLGTGGLVKAYTEVAQLCLAQAKTEELVPKTEVNFTVPYSLYEQCKLLLASLEFELAKEEFGTGVSLSGRLKTDKLEALQNQLRDLSRGTIVVGGPSVCSANAPEE